jgi:hypothetical protein
VQTELESVVTDFIKRYPGIELELAEKFEVAPSTVRRWASGTARPHPDFAKLIIGYLKRKSKTG